MGTTAYRCKCCLLLHTLQQGQKSAGDFCITCTYHRASEIHQTAKRHSEHEAMLRERLAAASKSAEDATAARKEFGEKMHWALRSRDRAIKVLRQISDLHELRPNGSCTCGKPKSCKIADLLDDRGIQKLIRRIDEYEDEMRRQEQFYREMEATGQLDRWEEFVKNERVEQGPGRSSGTA